MSENQEPDYCHRRDVLKLGCDICDHEHCGWCPECHPEVPEW